MTHGKPFVKIVWHDAADHGSAWVPETDVDAFAEEVVEVTSWGWLVRGSRKSQYVTIAADHIRDGEYGRVTKIPSGMIVSIDEFKQE